MGRGLKSHLELGFFSKFPFDANPYRVVISNKDSLAYQVSKLQENECRQISKEEDNTKQKHNCQS